MHISPHRFFLSHFCLSLFIAASISALVSAAHAESLAVTGGEISTDRNAFAMVGLITPLSGDKLGNGWVGKMTLHALTYSYEKDPTTVDADAYGGDISLGYQGSANGGWWGAYAGLGARNTDLSPNDPDSDVDGTRLGLILGLEGEQHVTDAWKLNGMGNYTIGSNAYWTRVRVLGRLKDSMHLGPEVGWQGDPQYRSWQTGLALVGIPLSDMIDFGIKGGVRKTTDQDAGPYGGIEMGVRF